MVIKKTLLDQDTIAALATAPGEGGIAVIRMSGPETKKILNKIFRHSSGHSTDLMESHKLYHGSIHDPESGEVVDEVLSVIMKSPNSYTGEDVAEIHSHGGYLVPRKILELIYKHDARPAEAGEFSLKAFLNGKMDLTQAEAVIDVINAQTDVALKQAEMQLEGVLSNKISIFKEVVLDLLAEIESQVDFPEEDIDPLVKDSIISRTDDLIAKIEEIVATYEEGRIIKYGVTTTILGKPNVGKSSLLNSLLMKERAIVSHHPGTTRDFIEESIDVRGIPLNLIDTAGIRAATDHVEKAGIELTRKKAKEAELLIAVIDGSSELDQDDEEVLIEISGKNAVLAVNKSDLQQKLSTDSLTQYIPPNKISIISAKNNSGIDELKDMIRNSLVKSDQTATGGEIMLTELRHKSALEETVKSLQAFLETFIRGESPEFSALELRTALNHIGEITGEVTTEDVLGRIFSKFCVGK